MTLRTKLLLSAAPLAVALLLVAAISSLATTRLGAQSRLILADNYRSVLAAQRMKEALERVDSHVLYLLAGHTAGAAEQIAANRHVFDSELRVQEGNITEAGEGKATAELRAAWDAYGRALDTYLAAPGREARDRAYFEDLQPAFKRAKQRADEILAINQDAMLRKSDRVAESARLFEQLVVAAVVLAVALGLLASGWLAARMLRPLRVVNAAMRRFGEGDARARADVRGDDELAQVATEFNQMAERLERYRASSLGELLTAQQAAQAAIDGLPDPVLMLDAGGKLQGTNTAASALLGVDPDRPAGEALEHADPSVRAVVDRLRAHVLAGKGAYVPRGFEDAVRIPGSTPDGERILLPRATPIYDDAGAVSGAAMVLQDATRLFRFDQLKNDLVATVAHEFRTPLTSLRMALHLCTEEVVGPLNAKQADLLYAAREDCERLQLIVDDLLNLSRIEAGNVELHRRRVDPTGLVDAAVEVHRAAAEQARLSLRAQLLPGLPDVFADPDRLQLVFANLLTNAIRYAPAGSELVVWAKLEESPARAEDQRVATAGRIRFGVTDHGPGIAKAHQGGLFEKFFRVPGSPAGGSGLGLFISKGLVQAHGGEIGVDSDAGEGATFWFTVPVAAA